MAKTSVLATGSREASSWPVSSPSYQAEDLLDQDPPMTTPHPDLLPKALLTMA